MKTEDGNRKKYIDIMTENLPVLRAKFGISQSELGRRIGVTRQQIANYERRTRTLTWTSFLALVSVFMENEGTRQLMNQFGICEEGEISRKPLSDDDLLSVAGGADNTNHTGAPPTVDFEIVYSGNFNEELIRSMVQEELRARKVPEYVIANTPPISVYGKGDNTICRLRIIWNQGDETPAYMVIF